MTNLPEFLSLLVAAEKAYAEKSEEALDTFIALYNDYPADGLSVIEGAMLEVISDLTVHEYMCHGTHEHEEQV